MEGALIVTWFSASHGARELVIQRVTDEGDCVREDPSRTLHVGMSHGALSNPDRVYRLQPGLYAITSITWDDDNFPVKHLGASRLRKDARVFTVASGMVTYLGAWTIISPFPQRYELASQDMESRHHEAVVLAQDFGAMIDAAPAPRRLAFANEACARAYPGN